MMRIHYVADHNYSPIDNIAASSVPRSIRVFYPLEILSPILYREAAVLWKINNTTGKHCRVC